MSAGGVREGTAGRLCARTAAPLITLSSKAAALRHFPRIRPSPHLSQARSSAARDENEILGTADGRHTRVSGSQTANPVWAAGHRKRTALRLAAPSRQPRPMTRWVSAGCCSVEVSLFAMGKNKVAVRANIFVRMHCNLIQRWFSSVRQS